MMKAGISTKTLQSHRLRNTIPLLAERGYELIEIWVEQIWRQEKKLYDFKKFISNITAEFSIHGPTEDLNICSMNRAIRSISVEQHLQAIDTTADLGVSNLVIHPGRCTSLKDRKESVWEILFESLEVIIERAAKKNIQINIENMENRPKEFVIYPHDINRILNHFELPVLGVTLDTAHLTTVPDCTLEKFCGEVSAIRHVHISDSSNDKVHLPLGLGSEKLPDVFKTLKKYHCSGFVIEGLVPGRELDVVDLNINYWKKLKEKLCD